MTYFAKFWCLVFVSGHFSCWTQANYKTQVYFHKKTLFSNWERSFSLAAWNPQTIGTVAQEVISPFSFLRPDPHSWVLTTFFATAFQQTRLQKRRTIIPVTLFRKWCLTLNPYCPNKTFPNALSFSIQYIDFFFLSRFCFRHTINQIGWLLKTFGLPKAVFLWHMTNTKIKKNKKKKKNCPLQPNRTELM